MKRNRIILTCFFLSGIIMILIPIIINLKGNFIQNNLINNYKKNTNYQIKNINYPIKKENIKTTNKMQILTKGTEQNFNIIGILKIPKILLEAPISSNEENLNYVVVKYSESAEFGKYGNTILAGHNNMAGSIFKNLHKLNKGDSILIESNNKKYSYTIEKKFIVEPNDSGILTQQISEKSITLVTCINNAKQRLIIKGILIK